MTDNKQDRGKADRERINIHEAYEVEYWTKHFGVSKDKLVEAVKAVGVMARDVKAYLGK
jgi:hypothetical protein